MFMRLVKISVFKDKLNRTKAFLLYFIKRIMCIIIMNIKTLAYSSYRFYTPRIMHYNLSKYKL